MAPRFFFCMKIRMEEGDMWVIIEGFGLQVFIKEYKLCVYFISLSNSRLDLLDWG
jgi:hypothetical protein